jgi:ribosomal subunit interface protein
LIFTITGKHVDLPVAVREHALKKTSKLDRYYSSVNKIEVIVDAGKAGGVIVEIIVRAEHSKVFVGSQSGEDVYQCIDLAVHKLEQQLRKRKGKEREDKRAGGAQLT